MNLLRFMGFSSKIIRLLSIIAVITLLFGLFLSFSAPEDYRQGVLVKIMFLHVPFSWLSLLCYIMMTVCAIRILCSQCFFSGIALRSAAPIGSVFTVLALITGSLWGRPVWGTWWEWDARLTSMLIFLLIYLSIVSLSRAFENSRISTQATAILTIIGCINVPIIEFSVNWWNTLHQAASVLRWESPAISLYLLIPLMFMMLAFTMLFILFQLMSMRNDILHWQIIVKQDCAYNKGV
ncbi:MAG: heme exporter protein C [Candidatus Tokpelaia sp. JSC161]|nr:MAG: heme exporter protein C [Candidatus Tokpelaia sp. JSC161]